MATRFHHPRRVEFCETDAAGIVHFVSFQKYMEQAEHALLRSIGTSVVARRSEDTPEAGTISWPRVSCAADYHGAARFEEMLDIYVSIGRLGRSSVRYEFDIRRDEDAVCSGQITTVCCQFTGDEFSSVPIPDAVRTGLEPFLTNAH